MYGIFEEVSRKEAGICHAFCLLANHYHYRFFLGSENYVTRMRNFSQTSRK